MHTDNSVLNINQPSSKKRKISVLLKELFAMVSPYWRSEEKLSAWVSLVAVFILNMAAIYCLVLLNSWYGRFYDALQKLDKAEFGNLVLQFLFIVMSFVAISVIKYFTQAMLAFKWRIWLTKQVMHEWLENNTFYRLFVHKTKTENPDQRISQDLASFTTASLSLILTVVTELIKAITFAVILWKLSSVLRIPLSNGAQLNIPGYMLWITLIYVTLSTFIIYIFGKPLVSLDYIQEKVEADFRFSLMRIRERRDEVALLNGAKAELVFLSKNILNIITNYKEIIKRNIYVNSFQNIFNNLSTVLPALAASPMFFSGVITLGALQQIVSAFDRVESSLMTFALSFQSLASWMATFERIIDFRQEMRSINSHVTHEASLEINISNANQSLEVKDLTLYLASSQVLTTFNFKINLHERVLMMGRSGLGKSTLLKAIAGNWPYASGHISRPHNLMIIAQKPYFPISTLRASLLYPNLEANIPDSELQRVLTACVLPNLSTRLDETNDWNAVLSLGEQQRLNFARIILAKPAWLILDEPTSATDKALEKTLFTLLFKELPEVSLLTIGHSLTLHEFHTRCIEL